MLLVARENSGNMNLSSDSSTIYLPLSHSYLYIYAALPSSKEVQFGTSKLSATDQGLGVRESLFYKWFYLQATEHSNKSLKLFDL